MKINQIIGISTLFLLTASCNWVKERSKETIHGTGEVVGKAGSELASGIAKGVEKTFSNKIELSAALTKAGLSRGKVTVHSIDNTVDNVLSIYLIFNSAFDGNITAKVFTEDGLEYGRITERVKGAAGTARFVEFVFDKPTDIDLKGKITLD